MDLFANDFGLQRCHYSLSKLAYLAFSRALALEVMSSLFALHSMALAATRGIGFRPLFRRRPRLLGL